MKRIIAGLIIIVLGSCGAKKDSNVVVPTEETIDAYTGATVIEEEIENDNEEISIGRLVYKPSETVLTDLVHTKLEVNFDWTNSRMNGIATITAKPHFYASDNLILDAKGMDINSVSMNGKPISFRYSNDFLNVTLDKIYTRNDNYTVVIDYVAKPEERESEGSAAITDAKGLYFINPTGEDENKMPQLWTQGETEASSVWFPTIDSPNAKTTQEIFITVNDKYATLSNGALISSQKLENGKRVDHWKQDLAHAPYLFMMGVGEFKIVKDSYKRPDGSIMDVNYYVESEWESSAKAIFGETPEMIRHFSELLGVEYQWDKYHQIVVRDYVSGAMENTGAVIFGDYVYKNERELLDGTDQSTIAHELFHHWFGDLVTCESWSNLPLNESFANYSQYLWDEHRYGIDEADYNAEYEADGYFQSSSMQGHHDLIWFDYDDKEQMFDGHSYNKGGRILHMLRNYLGDEAFFAGIKNYLETNKFKAAEFHHLRLAFEEVSGEDLNWFFNQWFLGSGHPTLNFTQEIDSALNVLNVNVEQLQDFDLSPVYKLPFEIAIFDSNGKHTYKVEVNEVNESFSFPFEGNLNGFIYDDQQALLAIKSIDKTVEQYRYQYYNGKRYFARKEGLMGGTPDSSSETQQLILDAMSDSFWHIRVLAIGKFDLLESASKEVGITNLNKMVKYDSNPVVREAALNRLTKIIEDQNVLLVTLKDRIENDQSYSVVVAALRNLGKQNPEEALSIAESLESENSSSMIAGIAQIYAGHGGLEKFDFIANALSGNVVQGFDKLSLINSFTFYLKRQGPEELEKALPIYKEQSKTGGFYVNMFLPQNISHLEGHIADEIVVLENEIIVHEENENPVYADQARRKIVLYQEVLVKYENFSTELGN